MKKILAAISLMLGFAMPSWADDREQLIGVWKLQTYEIEFQDTGERKTQFGDHPNGFLIFTAEGRMMAVLTAEGRKVPQTDSDRAAALGSMFAYSGIYRLEGDHWTTKVDTSWNEGWTGTDQIRFFKLDGDALTVTSNWRAYPNLNGRVARGFLTWTREK